MILGNEIARVGSYLGYCWLVDAICGFLEMLVPTYREGGEGRACISVGG